MIVPRVFCTPHPAFSAPRTPRFPHSHLYVWGSKFETRKIHCTKIGLHRVPNRYALHWPVFCVGSKQNGGFVVSCKCGCPAIIWKRLIQLLHLEWLHLGCMQFGLISSEQNQRKQAVWTCWARWVGLFLLELMLSRHKRRENKRHLRIMKRPTAAVFSVFHLFFAEGKTSV